MAALLVEQVDWIDGSKLKGFILLCQDSEDGGIAERPGNLADIFHTFFGIAGLSLLGYFEGRSVRGESTFFFPRMNLFVTRSR